MEKKKKLNERFCAFFKRTFWYINKDIDYKIQAKGTLSKTSTIKFIFLELIWQAILSKINTTQIQNNTRAEPQHTALGCIGRNQASADVPVVTGKWGETRGVASCWDLVRQWPWNLHPWERQAVSRHSELTNQEGPRSRRHLWYPSVSVSGSPWPLIFPDLSSAHIFSKTCRFRWSTLKSKFKATCLGNPGSQWLGGSTEWKGMQEEQLAKVTDTVPWRGADPEAIQTGSSHCTQARSDLSNQSTEVWALLAIRVTLSPLTSTVEFPTGVRVLSHQDSLAHRQPHKNNLAG